MLKLCDQICVPSLLGRQVTPSICCKGDVKRLQDIDPPEFRLRLGDYRLRYHNHGESIEILRVLHRQDSYR